MNRIICFFAGHRKIPQDIFPAVLKAVEKCITELGVTEFIVGHYGEFDNMAAKAVGAVKKKYDVRLTLLLPYHPAEHFTAVSEDFDGTFYPQGMEKVPHRAAIIRANKYAVDMAECIICYVNHPGNSRNVVEYARRKNKTIIEIP